MIVFFKRCFTLLTILTFILAFSYSYKALGISNIVLFVALGIDIDDEDNLSVTFQFTDTSPVSQSGTTETKNPNNFTITAPSIHNAIALMSSYTGKEISLSHCKVIVFSEEIAKRGISSEIYTLINDPQIRPSTNIVISKCPAKDYLENTTPQFDNLITKYYESFTDSSIYNGYTSDLTISNFFSSMISLTKEPVAILGKVSSSSSPFSIKAEDFNSTENSGLAVFKSGVLVGELNETQSLSFQATTNNLHGFLISVPHPLDSTKLIDIYLTPTKPVNIDVQFVNSTPYILLDYTFNGRIYSASNNYDYLNSGTLEELSVSCDNYLNTIFSDFLYTTSKDFGSDICDLGQYARQDFNTLSEFENYNWKDSYINTFFNVSTNTTVKSGFLLSEN